MSLPLNHSWFDEIKREFLRNVSSLVFYLSPLTWDLLQERKQESSGAIAEAPKNKPLSDPLNLAKKNTLSKHCSCPSLFLCSCGVFLRRLICCWLLEFGVTCPVTSGDSGAGSKWLRRKQLDLLVRPFVFTLSARVRHPDAAAQWSTSIIKD